MSDVNTPLRSKVAQIWNDRRKNFEGWPAVKTLFSVKMWGMFSEIETHLFGGKFGPSES